LQDSALQGDRRAPSTVAAGDEVPMNSRECRVQLAFQGPTGPGLLRALLHERSSQPHERTGAEGTQRQEKRRILLLIGLPRPRVNRVWRGQEEERPVLGWSLALSLALCLKDGDRVGIRAHYRSARGVGDATTCAGQNFLHRVHKFFVLPEDYTE
jgi:hypothetical protein